MQSVNFSWLWYRMGLAECIVQHQRPCSIDGRCMRQIVQGPCYVTRPVMSRQLSRGVTRQTCPWLIRWYLFSARITAPSSLALSLTLHIIRVYRGYLPRRVYIDYGYVTDYILGNNIFINNIFIFIFTTQR